MKSQIFLTIPLAGLLTLSSVACNTLADPSIPSEILSEIPSESSQPQRSDNRPELSEAEPSEAELPEAEPPEAEPPEAEPPEAEPPEAEPPETVVDAPLVHDTPSTQNTPDDAVNVVDQSSIASSDLATPADSPMPCLNWTDYQRTRPAVTEWPRMPAGYDKGCVFRLGEGMSTPVHILYNDITFEDITEPGTTAPLYGSNPIPWFAGSELNDRFSSFQRRGEILTYYAACVTLGGQESYCKGFPRNAPYIINNSTACFRGQCLSAPGTHAIYLLSLWSWNPRIESRPTSFSVSNTHARNQYRTLPLNRLPSEVPLFGNPMEIATMAFGRTTLGEGEQPTVISGPEWDEADGLSIVYLTNKGAADDAVGGFRYRLDFVNVDGDRSQLLWVGEQRYCWRLRNGEWTGRELCP